jgi:magnesium-transporting ATPase (P-type)
MNPPQTAPRPQSNRAAIRSTSLMHVDEDVKTQYQQEISEAEKLEDAEYAKLREIAELDNHPGWQIIRKQFLQRIDEYRSGRSFTEAILAGEINNAELGELTRIGYHVANELVTLINSVAVSQQEVAERKEEHLNATISRRVVGSDT